MPPCTQRRPRAFCPLAVSPGSGGQRCMRSAGAPSLWLGPSVRRAGSFQEKAWHVLPALMMGRWGPASAPARPSAPGLPVLPPVLSATAALAGVWLVPGPPRPQETSGEHRRWRYSRPRRQPPVPPAHSSPSPGGPTSGRPFSAFGGKQKCRFTFNLFWISVSLRYWLNI